MSGQETTFEAYTGWLRAKGVRLEEPGHVAQLMSALAAAEDGTRAALRREAAALARVEELKADVASLRAEITAKNNNMTDVE